jgi:hypothetical protein
MAASSSLGRVPARRVGHNGVLQFENGEGSIVPSHNHHYAQAGSFLNSSGLPKTAYFPTVDGDFKLAALQRFLYDTIPPSDAEVRHAFAYRMANLQLPADAKALKMIIAVARRRDSLGVQSSLLWTALTSTDLPLLRLYTEIFGEIVETADIPIDQWVLLAISYAHRLPLQRADLNSFLQYLLTEAPGLDREKLVTAVTHLEGCNALHEAVLLDLGADKPEIALAVVKTLLEARTDATLRNRSKKMTPLAYYRYNCMDDDAANGALIECLESAERAVW